jgi:hypothetical protein
MSTFKIVKGIDGITYFNGEENLHTGAINEMTIDEVHLSIAEHNDKAAPLVGAMARRIDNLHVSEHFPGLGVPHF